ncbi:hypothetical protein NMY22_g9149 [Coprinellus aureogranulatus]|nr:hypothetical protein NMY22_g9149 [Coprinellus aureogranulatus]
MGGCVSTADRAGKARSDEIDRQIEEDNRRFKRECKILLLGEHRLLPSFSLFLRPFLVPTFHYLCASSSLVPPNPEARGGSPPLTFSFTPVLVVPLSTGLGTAPPSSPLLASRLSVSCSIHPRPTEDQTHSYGAR